ncbi:MAG: CBS domain-containing protein, partial [Actinomycetota bacterium]
RAAWRLEALGFSEVYDYKEGKLDWLAAGLATEGSNATRPRVGDLARKDAPVCSLDERLGVVADRVRAAGWNACVVVNDERIVLGLLRQKDFDADRRRAIEEVMQPGPSTFRPHVGAAEMAAFMVEHDLESSPITSSDGRLIGMLRRDDAVAAAHKEHEGHENG